MKYGVFILLFFSLYISNACGNNTKTNTRLEVENESIPSLVKEQENDSMISLVKAELEDIIQVEDTTLYEIPYYTANIKNYKSYFHQNSKFKDWDVSDRKKVIIRSIVEKDGTVSEVKIFEGCGIEEMDKEAYRLIKEAGPLDPGRDEDGNPVRSICSFVVCFPPL